MFDRRERENIIKEHVYILGLESVGGKGGFCLFLCSEWIHYPNR